jgi:glycerol-3-phosphate acyltransferase PlsX
MGGDFGPRVTVPASFEYLSENPRISFTLIGDQAEISSFLPPSSADLADRFSIVHTSDYIAMNEKPSKALRSKQSSMALALQAVKADQADACVSAGNTGALMVLARASLGMHEGIDRPAFITEIPTEKGGCHVLDLGANVNCEAKHLLQFAIMGSIISQVVDGKDNPRVGLLNVGQEDMKGNNLVKEAAALLCERTSLNYIGFVEGDHIFSDEADVIVCDGFVGNVALKTSEGLAKMINNLLRQTFQQNPYTKLLGLLMKPFLKKMINQIDPKTHNGASLLGLKGIVIKSHGNADAQSFKQAINRAVREVEQHVPGLIQKRISELGDIGS